MVEEECKVCAGDERLLAVIIVNLDEQRMFLPVHPLLFVAIRWKLTVNSSTVERSSRWLLLLLSNKIIIILSVALFVRISSLGDNVKSRYWTNSTELVLLLDSR